VNEPARAPLEGEVLPARPAQSWHYSTPALDLPAWPVHRHAFCGYVWQRARAMGPDVTTNVPGLCGDRVDLPQPATATAHCPQCASLARTHGQECDCFKLWPATVRQGSLAPKEITQ
jgi:hypothetical protein